MLPRHTSVMIVGFVVAMIGMAVATVGAVSRWQRTR